MDFLTEHRYKREPLAVDLDITIVLDSSGSMFRVQEDTIRGFNAFVDRQRAGAVEGKPIALSLVTFSNKALQTYVALPIKKVPYLTPSTWLIGGGTALLDAMGTAIELASGRKAEKTMIVTITDGEENTSLIYNRDRLFQLIKDKSDRLLWDFVFLGANQDAIAVAADYGIMRGKTMTYAANPLGTKEVFTSAANYSINNSVVANAAAMRGTEFTSEDRNLQKNAGAKTP